jgi:hypothetical protein
MAMMSFMSAGSPICRWCCGKAAFSKSCLSFCHAAMASNGQTLKLLFNNRANLISGRGGDVFVYTDNVDPDVLHIK